MSNPEPPKRSLPLTLSLFPVEFHLGDSLDREQPPFVTGIPSFFSLLFLLPHLPSPSTFALFLSPRVVLLFCFFFCFHSPQSSFSTFAGVLNTKGSDIFLSCSPTRSGQNPFYPVYAVKIGTSSEWWIKLRDRWKESAGDYLYDGKALEFASLRSYWSSSTIISYQFNKEINTIVFWYMYIKIYS